MRAAAMLRVIDCIAGRVRLAVPQATEWQRIGQQINAAMIFAGADFVNVNEGIVGSRWLHRVVRSQKPSCHLLTYTSASLSDTLNFQ